MSRRDLEFQFTAADDEAGGKALLSGIPAPLWTRFVARARELMPEKGADAWSAVVAEVMASIGGGGQSYTLILTDIPNAARTALDEIARSVELSGEQVIAQLYQRAEQERLHLLRIQELPGQPARTLLITGIPQVAWDAWAQVAQKLDERPEALFGMLLSAAANNQLQANRQVENANTATDGHGPRVWGPVEHAAGASTS